MSEPDADRNIRITDPRALRALAHPGRNRILERLQLYGPATATECAQAAGMSPSGCSWHLRMLARYGFVEESHDARRTDGRERVWRAVGRAWADRSLQEPRGWRDAALVSNSTIVVTAEELQDVQDRLQAVLAPYLLRDR